MPARLLVAQERTPLLRAVLGPGVSTLVELPRLQAVARRPLEVTELRASQLSKVARAVKVVKGLTW